MEFTKLNKEELEKVYNEYKAKIDDWKAQGINLDLTRGKPGKAQLDLSEDMLTTLSSNADCISENGTDCRNYGILDGIPEAKKLFSDLFNIPEKNIIVGGNASLNLMFDAMSRAMLLGVPGSVRPWCKEEKVKFLCPAPGYDRHFAICQMLGIEMIPIVLNSDGPDMDEVEKQVKDPAVKGMWCVPKFSNPDGVVYSNEVVERIGALKPAAPDFRVFWDNAYAIHEIVDEVVPLADIFEVAHKYGNDDMIYYFASTSKISFPGAGISMFAASDNNIAETKRVMGAQTIGYDKLNMLRHVKYFKNADGVLARMKEHAKVLKPKFEIVEGTFAKCFGGLGIARWTEPKGGYFVSLYVMDGCAKRVYELCSEIGVKLTKVGAAYPYGKDPHDSHLRIAPSLPDNVSLQKAIDILCDCVRFAAAEKLLNK